MFRPRKFLTVCTLAAAGAAVVGVRPASAQTTYPEAEPNSTKSVANAVTLMSGDSVSGITTGTTTSATSTLATTADYWRIKTAPAAPAIYRHELTFAATGTVAQTINQRGLTQTVAGTINAGTDAVFGTTNVAPRTTAWYGFGKQEEIYYSVTGTTSSTGTYTLTMTDSVVTPVVAAGALYSGGITVRTVRTAGSNMSRLDFWLYDSALNPLVHDVPSGSGPAGMASLQVTTGNPPDTLCSMLRTLPAGTYYLAISGNNLANNQPSWPTDTAGLQVMDFPDVVATSGNNVTVPWAGYAQLVDAYGNTVTSPELVFPTPWYNHVQWVQFTVSDLASGECCVAGACTVTDQPSCTGAWTLGGTCSPDPCGAPTGSCCVVGVCSITSAANCTGSWTSGGSCSPNPCAARCCASDGTCSIVAPAGCAGSWLATASSCEPNPCPVAIGACCNNTNGSCTLLYTGTCASGTTSTGGTTCGPSTCPVVRVCCNNTTGECTLMYGGTGCGTGTTVGSGLTCEPTTCPVLRVCCNNTTGVCTLMYGGTGCGTGTTVGSGLTCEPTTCPVTKTCCSNVDGACSVIYGGTCPANTTAGNGLVCDASACPSFGVCCVDTTCTFVAQANCTGTWTQGGTCNPSPCAFACCDPVTFACGLVATGGACSGTNLGFGSTCSPNVCPAPPNDTCTGATTLSIGTVSGYNNSAIAETLPACGGLTSYSGCVWYKFTPADNHRYEISTCDAGTLFNSRVGVYTSPDCSTFTCVGGNTFAGATACPARSDSAIVPFCATAGTTYYFAVASDTAATGAFVLTLTDLGDVCPPNDVCATAIPIVLGSSTAGNNFYAFTDANPAGTGACNTLSSFNKGVWYSFTDTSATPMRLRADLCDPATNFDATMYVYTSTNGCTGPMTCVWANATSGLGCQSQSAPMTDATGPTHTFIPSILNWTPRIGSEPLVTKCTTVTLDGNNNVVPTTYYILVTSFSATGGGNFVLHLEDTGESCNGTAPSHNLCSGGRPLTTFPFWDDVYPFDAQDMGPEPTCVTSAATLWYTFTPSVPGNFFYTKIPDEGASTTNTDSAITIFTAAPDCTALTEYACSTNADGFLTMFTTPTAHLNAGTTYYIQVSAAGLIPQAWNLGFNYVSDPGACCTAGVCSTTTSVDCTGTFLGVGTVCDPDPCAVVTGSCCATDGSCTETTQANCSATWTSGAVCSPNPCPQPAGACCRGTTCSVDTSANCTGANTSYKGNGTVCNLPGNNTTPCCRADYNQSGLVTVQDIFDFLGGYFSANPNADINASGGVTVQDIFDFLAAYFAGCA